MEEFGRSHTAVVDYIKFHKSKKRRQSKVIVSCNDYICFNGIAEVFASNGVNSSIIEINANEQFESHYYGQYSNMYQTFSFANGILSIKALDKKNQEIIIEILDL